MDCFFKTVDLNKLLSSIYKSQKSGPIFVAHFIDIEILVRAPGLLQLKFDFVIEAALGKWDQAF